MAEESLERQRDRNIERMRKCIGGIPKEDHTTKGFKDAFKKVKQMYQEVEMQERNLKIRVEV